MRKEKAQSLDAAEHIAMCKEYLLRPALDETKHRIEDLEQKLH